MGNSYTDDFFRDVYNSEIEQKHKLDSADSLLAVLLMALAGVAYYYLRLWPCCGWCVSAYFFIAFSILYFVAFCAATCSATGSFIPRKKAYISSPIECNDFVEESNDYFRNYHKAEEVGPKVDDELRAMLRKGDVKSQSQRSRELRISRGVR